MANGRVEYLFSLSFELPSCHPQAWPALARVILGTDEQEAESKHMKHEGNVNIYRVRKKTMSCPLSLLVKTSPQEVKADSFEECAKNVLYGKQGGCHVPLSSSCVSRLLVP